MINLLENSLINKIAAGEVVERPVSAVKELVENAIDAGAMDITIEIAEGGTSLIRVTDNGKGITKSDVKKAFLRHATSKINSLEDLESILTLGFRGEALSSISSVSQVEMITKTESETSGTRLELHGGEAVSESSIGSTTGTTIIVRNLFYNTPARRKFLKKSSVESGYISDLINRLALSHPEISFKYINNNSTIMQTKGDGNLKTAIFQIYGKDVSKNLLEVDSVKDRIKLTGFIVKPEISRGNRNYEHFFINGRYVKNDIVRSAVEQAYKTKLPIGKFPVFVLKMDMCPTRVDVNVHPTKLEVRFSEEELIYEHVLQSVSKVLDSANLIHTVKLEDKLRFSPEYDQEKPSVQQEFVGVVYQSKPKAHKAFNLVAERCVAADVSRSFDVLEKYREQGTSSEGLKKGAIYEPKSEIYNNPNRYVPSDGDKLSNVIMRHQGMSIHEDKPLTLEEVENKDIEDKNIISDESENREKEPLIFSDYKIVGQVFNTYWIVEQGKSMYVIDQHAGHERILFEQVINRFKNEKISSQKLIKPVVVNLSASEMEIYNQNVELFEDFGFEVEIFGEQTVAVRAVPYIFKEPSKVDFFIEIIDKLASIDTSISNIFELKLEKLASISCKAAVKANDKISYMEAKSLMEEVLKLKNPFTCPHGRPTIIEMSQYELEKMFKRT